MWREYSIFNEIKYELNLLIKRLVQLNIVIIIALVVRSDSKIYIRKVIKKVVKTLKRHTKRCITEE